ncbi:hypothetical protein CK934_24345 [Chitinophaga sp. MD30]|nr:hypothetical protein CK934_24345 [Chitinophaga sp. MD30]
MTAIALTCASSCKKKTKTPQPIKGNLLNKQMYITIRSPDSRGLPGDSFLEGTSAGAANRAQAYTATTNAAITRRITALRRAGEGYAHARTTTMNVFQCIAMHHFKFADLFHNAMGFGF